MEGCIRLLEPALELCDAVTELDEQTFPSSPWGREAFMKAGADKAEMYLAAEDRGLLGYVLFSNGPEPEIYRIAVAFERRRQGIGERLLFAALDHARRQGASRMFLEVREDNAPAIGLYEAAGFEVIYRRKGYYREDGCDALIMERRL